MSAKVIASSVLALGVAVVVCVGLFHAGRRDAIKQYGIHNEMYVVARSRPPQVFDGPYCVYRIEDDRLVQGPGFLGLPCAATPEAAMRAADNFSKGS